MGFEPVFSFGRPCDLPGLSRELFATLFDNDDAASYAAAQRLIGGRYDWLTSDVVDPSGDGPMMPPRA